MLPFLSVYDGKGWERKKTSEVRRLSLALSLPTSMHPTEEKDPDRLKPNASEIAAR